MELKLFDKWDTSEVIVSDIGLRRYINLSPVLVPMTQGRDIAKQFWKSKKPIVERLINRLFVTGHRGKKHTRTSSVFTGKKQLSCNIVKEAFEIIETKTKKNPVQVFVKALENGAPSEGIATIEYGGVRYPKSMDVSPQRRIDLSLRWLTQNASAASASAKAKKTISQCLADEIMATADSDQAKSNTIKKSVELQRQAEASR